MRKVFSVAMLIVGTMIGAGFCSGREIVSFFGSGISIAVAPLCGGLLFCACVLFLSVGARIRQKSFDKVNAVLLGKWHIAVDVFLAGNNLIVLSAMIAGLNSLCAPVLPLPVWGIAAAALCALITARGAEGLLQCNGLMVPMLVAVLGAVCVVGLSDGVLSASLGEFRLRVLPMTLIYVSMNMMLASTVLTTLGELSRKQIVGSSLLAAFLITALLALLITALNNSGNYEAEMPLLEIAASGGKGLYIVLAVVTGISIFTTMLTAVGGLCGYLEGKWGGKSFTATAVIAAGAMLSFLGFSRVVSLFYPLVGVGGIAYVILCGVYLARNKKKLPRFRGSFPRRESAKVRVSASFSRGAR